MRTVKDFCKEFENLEKGGTRVRLFTEGNEIECEFEEVIVDSENAFEILRDYLDLPVRKIDSVTEKAFTCGIEIASESIWCVYC